MIQPSTSVRTKLYIAGAISAVTVLFLYLVHSILTPFILAAVTAYILHPVVSWVSRRGRVRRLWVVLLVYAVSGLILLWVGLSVIPVIVRQVNDLLNDLPQVVQVVKDYFDQNDTIVIAGITINLGTVSTQLTQALTDIANLASRRALPVLFGVFEGLIKALVYLLATFYLLLDGERIFQFLVRITPAPNRDEMRHLLHKVNATLGDYLRGQLVLFMIMSVVTYIILTVLQVRYAVFLAVATGVLELVPFVGPYVAGGLAVSLAVTQPTAPFGWSNILLGSVIAVSYMVLRLAEDQIVIPNVIGRFVNLHPLVVIFVVLSGATVGGVLGLLLAVPLAATIKVVASHFLVKYWIDEDTSLAEQETEKVVVLPEKRGQSVPAE